MAENEDFTPDELKTLRQMIKEFKVDRLKSAQEQAARLTKELARR